jgi:hypothetical protein
MYIRRQGKWYKAGNSEKETQITYLPSFEADARMKADVVEHSRVHERHGEVWHAAELDHAINVTVDFGGDNAAGAVHDGVHLFDDVKVCLVVGVFDARSPPWDIAQLASGQRLAHAVNIIK